MAEIVNLTRARKARARREAAQTAAANRASFGRTKAERDRQAAQAGLAERKLDAALIGEDRAAED